MDDGSRCSLKMEKRFLIPFFFFPHSEGTHFFFASGTLGNSTLKILYRTSCIDIYYSSCILEVWVSQDRVSL